LKVVAIRNALALLVALLLSACAGEAHATKPCPPSPCQAPSGQLDRPKCLEAAAWVAVGTVTEVIRHPEGPPLSKDFAEFTFTVTGWEKGTGKVGQRFRFKVGWCENQQELPNDTSVPLRVFGASPSASGASRYMFLERLGSAGGGRATR
jgi:hypothetical protein